MHQLLLGLLFVAFSVFLRFISPGEKGNLLGYKSIQQGSGKKVWFWSNKCFGNLAVAGSLVYFFASAGMLMTGEKGYEAWLNRLGILYIFISIFLTEVYTYIKKRD